MWPDRRLRKRQPRHALGITRWTRQGVAPILAATRWERRHLPVQCAPVGRIDVETAFLLATCLLIPPTEATGACRLAVELREANGPQIAGLVVATRDGRVASRTTRLEGDLDAWATGGLSAWFAALIDRDLAGLQLGGDTALARALIDGLHDALFALPVAD